MKFGAVSPDEAEGGIVVHSIRQGDLVLKKGTLVGAAEVAALKHALARDCFYIGALGSRKTHARRVERLKQAGLTDADIARIHAPIGLPIGAMSPPEIAIAIMAEITQALRVQADRAAEAA